MLSIRKQTFRWLLVLTIAAAVGVAVQMIWLGKRSGEDRRLESKGANVATSTPLPIINMPQEDEGFVGSEACRACHAAISEQYSTHPMSRSLTKMDRAVGIENWGESSRFVAEDLRIYYAEKANDGFAHHERLEASDGGVIYDQSIQVDYAIGSGRRGRTYLINNHGPVCVSSLSWYSEGERWSLSPGYSSENHPRFSRRASLGCLACHSGRVAVKSGPPDQFADVPFYEESIGCERCHGPGATHIEWHTRRRSTEFDPIVNPKKLDSARREAVCSQCHLQGERRVTRIGKSDDSFRPGMHLSDVWIAFLKSGEVTDGRSVLAVSQFEQMSDSRCYVASRGRLGCVSCHSPHSIPKESDKEAYYRSQCLNCHSRSDKECSLPPSERLLRQPADSCVSCHMSRLSAGDVPHTTQTDHRILKLPLQFKDGEARAILNATGARPIDSPDVGTKGIAAILSSSRGNREPRIFIDNPEAPSKIELGRAIGIAVTGQAVDARNATLARRALEHLTPVLREFPDDIDALYATGQCYLICQEPGKARYFFGEVIRRNPQHEWSIEQLAIQLHESRDIAAALPYYRQLLQINPWRPEYHGRYAHLLGMRGQIDLAIVEANRALELNPTLIQTHQWLSQVYERRGSREMSQKHTAIVERFRGVRPR